ncbi:hypothetical protein HG535_0D02160 [Zygotorulaspora mrakii]|uniref:Uncharacterized protein n=1 Tax=Zygotorulaspora mrakii TaxID=42260 RepID=A0A7H9B1J0_ZYGMR|nr:uncharacterized protein HG535_0D02160 [Zygotorulaspora mrakii]QLG72508.1 hypothetical protein HG535_0D02160 [Zygotorulaspora mrakii]
MQIMVQFTHFELLVLRQCRRHILRVHHMNILVRSIAILYDYHLQHLLRISVQLQVFSSSRGKLLELCSSRLLRRQHVRQLILKAIENTLFSLVPHRLLRDLERIRKRLRYIRLVRSYFCLVMALALVAPQTSKIQPLVIIERAVRKNHLIEIHMMHWESRRSVVLNQRHPPNSALIVGSKKMISRNVAKNSLKTHFTNILPSSLYTIQ